MKTFLLEVNLYNSFYFFFAYAVEVLAEDAVQTMQVIKALIGDQINTFVPYSLKAKFPSGYIQAMKYQTLTMNRTRVVVLQNISSDTMFYILPYINTINGVLDLLPDSNVGENGRHTVLVDNASFKRIRNTITQNLDKWIVNHVSSDALPREEQFLGPPRGKPIHEDGLSSGENSWMLASNASFLSMDLSLVREHQYYDETTNITEVLTYANITLPTQTPIQSTATATTTDMTTDVTSELTEIR